jgi:hypothetical protein
MSQFDVTDDLFNVPNMRLREKKCWNVYNNEICYEAYIGTEMQAAVIDLATNIHGRQIINTLIYHINPR